MIVIDNWFWFRVFFRGSMKPAACFIIPVNIEDRPLFPPFQTCMHFVRHTGAPPLGCQNGNYFSIAVLILPIEVTSIRNAFDTNTTSQWNYSRFYQSVSRSVRRWMQTSEKYIIEKIIFNVSEDLKKTNVLGVFWFVCFLVFFFGGGGCKKNFNSKALYF